MEGSQTTHSVAVDVVPSPGPGGDALGVHGNLGCDGRTLVAVPVVDELGPTRIKAEEIERSQKSDQQID